MQTASLSPTHTHWSHLSETRAMDDAQQQPHSIAATPQGGCGWSGDGYPAYAAYTVHSDMAQFLSEGQHDHLRHGHALQPLEWRQQAQHHHHHSHHQAHYHAECANPSKYHDQHQAVEEGFAYESIAYAGSASDSCALDMAQCHVMTTSLLPHVAVVASATSEAVDEELQPHSDSPPSEAPAGRGSLRLRPHSTPATLCWLERNYELSEGVCIPRNVVYFNYVDFCSKNQMQPVNAASFGKIIRQMFANLTTRRLGTRGQSRYHYYGLAVKPDSIYYSPNYSSKKMIDHSRLSLGVRFSAGQRPFPREANACAAVAAAAATAASPPEPPAHALPPSPAFEQPHYACAADGFASPQVLPEFPSLDEFPSGSCISPDKIQTLTTMYRAHCQRVMESVNKFSFSEIPHLFGHFWHEVPPHVAGLLGQNVVVTLIGVCDAILYRTVLKAILPTPFQIFPENVIKIVRKFADDVVGSLRFALKHVPDNLAYVKMKLVRQMSKLLKRRTSVNHLYQAACLVISPAHPAVYEDMAQDWIGFDVSRISDECASKVCSVEDLKTVLDKFSLMLHERRPVGHVCVWVGALAETHMLTASADAAGLVAQVRRFLVQWTAITSKALNNLKRAKSRSSFHLLHLLLNEFIVHEVERLMYEDSTRELMLNLMNAQASELSDSSFADTLGPDFLSNTDLFPVNTVAAHSGPPKKVFKAEKSPAFDDPEAASDQEQPPGDLISSASP